ncbi:MAG: hypothetical protein KDD89_09455, partial [Anaerolineales bacterium]|nr:hypothetical protein [Anaerolineales bacterium]
MPIRRQYASHLIVAFLLLPTLLWLSSWASAPATGSPEKSTPDLIQEAVDAGHLDRHTAEQYLTYALTDPSQLPAEYHSTQAWDGTLALLSLTADAGTAVADLPPHRQAIQDALTSGSCGPMNAVLPHVYTTPHFFIEYDTIGGGLTIEEYAAVLETTYTTLIHDYGWAAPPTNDALNGRYPVRVEALGMGLYGFMSDRGDYAGFVGDNPSTPWPEKYAYKSCIVLHQDYSGFLSPPEAVLRSTVAHEFTHAVQHGYGALRNHDLQADMAFVEGTATLMEDEIFDNANDNYHYLWPEFDSCMGQYGGEPVSAWLVFRGLIERFGTAVAGGGEDVIQQVWETSGQATSLNNLQALSEAFDNKGVNLTEAYHDYAIAARFTKACGAGYPAPYCFEEGA